MKSAKHITVCINHRANPDTPSCGARGGLEIADALRIAIAEQGLAIDVRTFQCLGKCELGPNAKLSPGGDFCHGIQPENLTPLLEKIAAFAAI
jgi:NADH:ubiquinone oxidoreductase subunit E